MVPDFVEWLHQDDQDLWEMTYLQKLMALGALSTIGLTGCKDGSCKVQPGAAPQGSQPVAAQKQTNNKVIPNVRMTVPDDDESVGGDDEDTPIMGRGQPQAVPAPTTAAPSKGAQIQGNRFTVTGTAKIRSYTGGKAQAEIVARNNAIVALARTLRVNPTNLELSGMEPVSSSQNGRIITVTYSGTFQLR